MTAFVFVGPTLAADAARAHLDAVYLPPVAQGDVYRVSCLRPTAIGIVDGYFESLPAVWHKEVLWAMKQGVHMYGSASMGALRAAELEAFGMVGVGEIFRAFRDGEIEDDDEVAIAHGESPAYATFSEAMVNIRATLRAAAEAGVLTPDTSVELTRLAKSLFYADRSYPALLQLAASHGLADDQLRAFDRWLPEGRRDQKREDALTMLHHMRERQAADSVPKQVSFAFQHTDMWEELRGRAGRLSAGTTTGVPMDTVFDQEVLDELRIRGDGSYAAAREATLARLLAIEESRRLQLRVTESTLDDRAAMFRSARGLLDPEAVRTWCDDQELSVEAWWRLVEDETRVWWVRQVTAREVDFGLPDTLRVRGEYGDIVERARSKRRVLEELGASNPALSTLPVPEDHVLHWYFCDRLGLDEVPETAAWAVSNGFADDEEFRSALAREYCFATCSQYAEGWSRLTPADGPRARPQARLGSLDRRRRPL